uniref:Mitochondrial carrier 1 n=1 Tax=Sander lucioperca TaxID=283035 RepID=A0A8D0D766_SANLU
NDNFSGSQDATPTLVDVDTALLLLGAGVTAITHPLLYVKLLIQVGHEPLPPTVGTTMFGRRVLYLPGFFSYAHHIVKVDGKRGLFRGLSPRIVSSAISTVVRSKVKQVSIYSNNINTVLQYTVCLADHLFCFPLAVMSVRCMAQFVGREVKYGLSSVLCVCSGLIPHVAGEVLFLWFCNLLAHFINTYAVDESFTQASAIRSYTKFVMGIAVIILLNTRLVQVRLRRVQIHFYTLSWPQNTISWPQNTLSWPQDTISWPQDTLSWPQNTISWPQDSIS